MAPPSEIAAARRRLFRSLVVGGTVLVLLLGLPSLARLYTELLWFRSLGRGDVFTTVFWTRVLLGFAVGAMLAVCLEINLRIALRLTARLPSMFLRDATGTARIDLGRIAPRVLRPFSVIAGIIAGIVASQYWSLWLKFDHAVDFGVADPIFGQDVGFYVFDLPVHEASSTFAIWAIVLSFLVAAAAHVSRGGLVYDGRAFTAHRRSRVHLTVLVALLFLLLAYDAWIDTRQLLYSTTGPVLGASYADVKAELPALRVLIGAALVAAVLCAVSATRQRLVLLFAAAGLYLAVALLGVRLYPALIQRFDVLPNEAAKEAPYIAHNIEATRAGYGLTGVQERDLSGRVELTIENVTAERATIENIRLWDHGPLLDTFAQIQEIRTYYDFASVDNDRYVVDGQLRQTMLSPRELSAESLPNRTWINEHFTFTHGYGLTLGPVNQATEEGLPVLYVKDIPPVSSVSGIDVTRPAIYFGELSNDHVFVHTEHEEFDHPSGEENVHNTYDGDSGVSLESPWVRFAMSARLGSVKLLLSDDITSDSRVLLRRDIRRRVRALAPFLQFDQDPYMVVREDGTLVWIQDAYTTTSGYPYSERSQHGTNYIRNSVKVIIDAYHGSVRFYAADEDDPLLATWRRVFPGMFQSLEKLPDDLRAHLRHPLDLFRLQTEMFTVYHMEESSQVYNREDQWEIPAIRRSGGTQQMEPYYTVMRLPGEDEAEFILMLPFTPKRKDNLAAWMVARSDGDKLGQLRVYRFPRDRLVFGPQQVMNRINQDAKISRQISLWDQRGSQALLGTLLVIPVQESLIYVCPLYLRSADGRIPELKRVIVAYGNDIAMEPTLDGAISAVFRDAAGPAADRQKPDMESEATAQREPEPEPDIPTTEPAPAADRAAEGEAEADEAMPAELANRAQEHFEKADRALDRGDWATYGEQMERVRELVRRLAEASR